MNYKSIQPHIRKKGIKIRLCRLGDCQVSEICFGMVECVQCPYYSRADQPCSWISWIYHPVGFHYQP
uniref:Uncharacterized protein n=1 Tax=Anguilla anguilla TaxID=7936 RepID=A0A0E9S8G2_ANGAN